MYQLVIRVVLGLGDRAGGRERGGVGAGGFRSQIIYHTWRHVFSPNPEILDYMYPLSPKRPIYEDLRLKV